MFQLRGVWTLVNIMPTTFKRKLKDFKRSDANIANIIKDFSFDEKVCAFSTHDHFDFNGALHIEHPNAIGSFNASKIGRNWFNITHVTHIMNFATIFHVEIT